MPGWDDFLTARDKIVFAGAGYGARAGFGSRPVVAVVDVNYGFCGDRPLPILESIEEWHHSCGEEAWEAVAHIERLLAVARSKRIPIFYSTDPPPNGNEFLLGRWADKNARGTESIRKADAERIVEPLAPRANDVVIEKTKPSVFFGTLFAAYLADLSADSIIVCGATTSGCVRATVVDGFSFNYRIAVVEECTFDRGQASHALGLFEMNAKYADVVGLDETIEFLLGLDDDLFVADMPALS